MTDSWSKSIQQKAKHKLGCNSHHTVSKWKLIKPLHQSRLYAGKFFTPLRVLQECFLCLHPVLHLFSTHVCPKHPTMVYIQEHENQDEQKKKTIQKRFILINVLKVCFKTCTHWCRVLMCTIIRWVSNTN